MKLTYPACFYKDSDSDAYAVVVPDLPGCVSGGHSLSEAILMGADAASGWVLDELESGRHAPPASAIDDIKPEKGGFVSLLMLDMDAYAAQHGDAPVNKNLSIPAYLATFAESRHIDISEIAQEALSRLYQDQQVASG